MAWSRADAARAWSRRSDLRRAPRRWPRWITGGARVATGGLPPFEPARRVAAEIVAGKDAQRVVDGRCDGGQRIVEQARETRDGGAKAEIENEMKREQTPIFALIGRL